MKKLLPILSLLFLSALTIVPGRIAQNEIKGKINLSSCNKVVVKGSGYNADGTEIMHSEDPRALPDQNVIISMHPMDFEPELTPTKDAYMTQTEQTFLPHVLPVVVGSKVHFLNEDEFFHNVQSYTPKSRFSIGRRAPGISYSVPIKKVGVIDLMCDIHSHMSARILSFDTPYFSRIDANGTYSVKNLPDGRYRIEVFHPHCDKIVDQVEIAGGKVFEFDFDLSIKP